MTSFPHSATRQTRATSGPELPAASFFQRMVMFSVGLALPMVSFSRSRSFTADFSSRVMVVDGLCIAALALLLITRKVKFYPSLLTYYFAMLLATAVALTQAADAGVVVALAALIMATLYSLLGHSVGQQPALAKALIAGILAGAMCETVVVVHDFFLSPWFPDKNPNRVRGTFRTSGQLAVYGFGVAGVLLTFGWTYFKKTWSRAIVILAGFSAVFFVFAASRRSGLFALLAWLAAYLVLGLRQASRKTYFALLVLLLLATAWLSMNSHKIAGSFAGKRFLSAADNIAGGTSFTHMQFSRALDRIAMWFPFGVGVSQGEHVVAEEDGQTKHEIHNSHLALAVELGLLGLVAFYLMGWRCTVRSRDMRFGKFTKSVRPALIGFSVSAAIFMVHNRLHRERVAMLFLGLAPVAFSVDAHRTGQRSRVPRYVVIRRPRVLN